ncbi:MAG: hypothetical protein HY842_04195 [Bacteroidetes bacterium]|nr:hypothetical protein [Bacteroidota bacterium]
MNTAELKNDLIKIIINTDDIVFLRQVRDYFKTHWTDRDWWDEISEEEKQLIEAGMRDIESGNVVSHEEVRAEINKILKKN